MKRFLPALILIIGFSAACRADSEPDAPSADDSAKPPQVTVEVEMGAADSPDVPDQELGQRIRSQVLAAIKSAIEEDPDLSDVDKQAIERKLEKMPHRFEFDFDESTSAGELLLGGLAIVLIFGTPVMLVAAILYAGYRKRRLASDMASKYLASGEPVPPEVWRGLSSDTTPRSNLHKGMIMVGTGLGILLCFWLMDARHAAYLGLIPMFIGIAQLLIWKLEMPNAGNGK